MEQRVAGGFRVGASTRPGRPEEWGEWTLVDEAGTTVTWTTLGRGVLSVSFAGTLATDPERSLIVLLSAYVVLLWWDSHKGGPGPSIVGPSGPTPHF
jgi:hypothetical protein